MEITKLLTDRFGTAVVAAYPQDKHPRIHVNAGNWRKVAEYLRHEPALAMDWLSCLSGVDYVASEQLCVVYDFRSTVHEHLFCVKVYVDRKAPKVETVCDLWPAAEWHEREAFDMFGIEFINHPDLRRILLPEDWQGYPLRKDYVFPAEYHGIPGTYEKPAMAQGQEPAVG